MKWKLSQTVFICLFVGIIGVMIGCDTPNDEVAQPYRFVQSFSFDGIPEDISAQNGHIAVADDRFGNVVFSVDGSTVTQTRLIPQFAGIRCQVIDLDPVNPYVTFSTRFSGSDGFRIHDYSKDSSHAEFISLPFDGPTFNSIFDLSLSSTHDTVTVWSLDSLQDQIPRFLHQFRWVRTAPDTVNWNYLPERHTTEIPGIPIAIDRRSDGLVAIAVADGGIVIFDPNTFSIIGTVDTPHFATDCAWFGNDIAVADQFGLTIINSTDPAHPVVVSDISLTAPGATTPARHLFKVIVDGNFAFVVNEFDGVYVVDISNPRAPVMVQHIDTPDPSSVAALDGRLFVTDRALGMLYYQH